MSLDTALDSADEDASRPETAYYRQCIGEYEPQQPEDRGLLSITEATYPDAQCPGEYEPKQPDDCGLLSITEATYSGAQPSFVRRFTSFVLPPIHQPLRLPALRLRRGHVVVQGPRNMDRWAEPCHYRMGCALLELALPTGALDMAQHTRRAPKRNLVRWTGMFPR